MHVVPFGLGLCLAVAVGLPAMAENRTSAAATPVWQTPMDTFVLRLSPGDDILAALDAFCQTEGIDAGCILSAVGSLKQASLRFSNQSETTLLPGTWEIVSLSGRLSRQGHHLHMAVADKTGRTLGGHVMAGNRVYTTLELVIARLPDLTFQRNADGSGTYRRLDGHPAGPRVSPGR